MNSTKVSKRILALDILRGVTIAGMIMVNNPGSSCLSWEFPHTFP